MLTVASLKMPAISGNMETSKNSLEFRASIIPYDTSEDPNAPILASSGDNINLIFNIPKDSFRKLAVAAIAHLGPNSDVEQVVTANGSIESNNDKQERSSKTSKFRLSDVVNDLEVENTKDIIDAYEEDSNASEISKNKDVVSADPKSCVNGDNASLEVCNESVHDYETENQNAENKGNRAVLSEDLDLSDCPELENAWPDVHPFTETEKIAIEEMESLVLNGFITKYLKLEFSNEFVMIKVTSESNVLVDAVKYKETGKESLETEGNLEDSNAANELSRKESECSEINSDILPLSPASQSNKNEDSMDETVSLVDENESGDQKDVNVSCISEGECTTTETGNSCIVDPEKNLKIELEEPTTANAESIAENSSLPIKTSQNLSSESNSKISADLFLLKSSLETSKFGEMDLKLEEKLEELDTNIAGTSPTERLKFALRESLKDATSEVDTKQAEVSVANTSQIFLENSDSVTNASETDNLPIKEKRLEDSLDECVTESSEICDSNELNVECHESENSNKESNSEKGSCETDLEHDLTLPEEIPSYNSSNANEDSTSVEKLDLNDRNYKGENSRCHVEKTNKQKESNLKPIEQKDSLEDSALGKDLHFSENEVVNDSKFEDMECKEAGFQEILESIKCEIEENESLETKDNEIPDDAGSCTSKSDNDLQNELCEEVIEENGCQADIVTEDSKLENFENSLAESIAEEKSISENISEDEISPENSFQANNAGFKNESNGELKDVKVKTENAEENLDTNIEVIVKKSSDHDSSETHSKSFEKESLEPSSEYLEDSVSETTDAEEKLPENSFASNKSSFMDTTVDANVESASECGDMESDDVKSVASESDDSRDSFKYSTSRRNGFKTNREADEVDCAPTRTRRKAIPELSRDAIPENSEFKSTKKSSRHTTLDTPSKYSGRISPLGRSLRSKSLDPVPPNKGNLHDKKHGSVESEELPRRTRAKTPDVIGKKDIKTTARSSPRKLGRSNATTDASSTSKVHSTKSSGAESKSRSNLDSSVSTKRSKRGTKE